MRNELLVELVNSLLGTGKSKSKGNLAYICPFHTQKVPSEKLEINFDESSPHYQNWGCWVCGEKARGKKLYSLFKKIDAPQIKFNKLKSFKKKGSIIDNNYEPSNEVKLPEEFISLTTPSKSLGYRQALSFLRKKGITSRDIQKYNIGYCEKGTYSNRVIIPSYDGQGSLNFFTARAFTESFKDKYKNPPCSRDIIPFELFINWDLPIILCEGVFDALSIKRNAIPLLGTVIQNNLMKRLVTSKVEKIFIALDSDAIKKSLKYSDFLREQGKKVYLVDLKEKDPNEMGFEKFTELVQTTPQLTRHNLMALKLSLI